MTEQGRGSHSGAQGGESSHPQGPQQASLREFAARIGVSDTAIRKGIKAGRLKESLGKTAKNQPYIKDVAVAEREWTATSRTATGVRTNGSQLPESGSHPVPAAAEPPPAPASTPKKAAKSPPADAWREESDDADDNAGGQLVFASTLIDAQTAATNERARKLKFENDVTEGRLIPIERVTKEAFEAERIIRENILNLPSRIAGELAALTDTGLVHMRLDAALREALNTTADMLLATVNE